MPRSCRGAVSLRGINLVEVVIASALMQMLLLAFYGVGEMMQRTQMAAESRSHTRQTVRAAFRAFHAYATRAAAFFPGSGAPQGIGGYPCRLPLDGETGDTVAVAVPLDVTCPRESSDDPRKPGTAMATGSQARADGFPDNVYQVVVLTSRPLHPPDSRNPGAREMVLMRWEEVVPAQFLAPLTIDLEALGEPDSQRVFKSYLKPLEQDGLRVAYRYRGSSASAAFVHAEYAFQNLHGPLQSDVCEHLFATRNLF